MKKEAVPIKRDKNKQRGSIRKKWYQNEFSPLHDVRACHRHVDRRAAHLAVVALDHVDGRGGRRPPLAGLRRVPGRGQGAASHAAGARPELAGPVAGLCALDLHLLTCFGLKKI